MKDNFIGNLICNLICLPFFALAAYLIFTFLYFALPYIVGLALFGAFCWIFSADERHNKWGKSL